MCVEVGPFEVVEAATTASETVDFEVDVETLKLVLVDEPTTLVTVFVTRKNLVLIFGTERVLIFGTERVTGRAMVFLMPWIVVTTEPSAERDAASSALH